MLIISKTRQLARELGKASARGLSREGKQLARELGKASTSSVR